MGDTWILKLDVPEMLLVAVPVLCHPSGTGREDHREPGLAKVAPFPSCLL